MVYPKYERELKPGEGSNLKSRVALVTRVLAYGGILPHVYGHCTARVPGGNRIYITPHFHWQGKILQEVADDDIHLMDLEGNPLDCDSVDMPEERCFYTEIYKARPELGAIIYGHPRLSNAFADAGRDTLSVFGTRVPLIEPPGFGNAIEVGQKVVKGLGEHHLAVFWPSSTFIGPSGAMTTAAGGTVVVGRTIEEACVTAFTMEREAEMQLFVTILGGKPRGQSIIEPPNHEAVAKQVEVRTVLEFPYYAAMDRGPRRETRGLLFWP